MKKLLLIAIALLLSLSQGNAATKFSELEGGRVRNILQTASGTIVASTQTNVYAYDQTNDHWNKIYQATPAQTQNSIYTTTDNSGNSGIVFYAQGVQGYSGPSFLVSLDEGATWNEVTFPTDITNAYNVQVYQAFSGELIVNMRIQGKFHTYITKDNCQSFEEFEEQNARIEPYDDTYLRQFGTRLQKYIADYEWSDLFTFENTNSTYSVTENFIYVLDGKKFYLSPDDGENWTEASTGLDFVEDTYYPYLFTGANDRVILYIMSIDNQNLFNYFYSYDSSNETWTKIYDTEDEPINGLPVCILNNGNVLTTSNQGVISQESDWGLLGSGIHGVIAAQVLLTNDDKIMYVDGSRLIYMCNKDGSNRELSSYYDVASPTSAIFRIFKAKDGNLIVTNADGVYTSTDNGETWVNTLMGPTGVLKESPAKNLYFAYDNNVYKSEDGGVNWDVYYENNTVIATLAVNEMDELYISDQDDLFKLDSEMNPTTILEEASTYPFYHQDNGLLVLTYLNQFTMAVRKSNDGGTTFTEVTNQLNPPQNGYFGLEFAGNGDFLISANRGFLSVKANEDTLSYTEVDGAYFISNFFALDATKALLLDIYGTIYEEEFITSVEDIVVINDESVFYPNPVANEVTFKENLREAKFLVFDNMGKLAYTATISGINQSVNLSDLGSGVYFYRLETGKSIKVGKFIKK
jgi:hypothetical protein